MFKLINLVLDGAAKGNLSTLSLSGCALSANDIQPLCKALRQGMKLHMLKLSANRLEDAGVVGLAEAISANKTHPLAVLDVSDNTVQPFLSYLFQCNVLFDGKNNFFNFIRYGFFWYLLELILYQSTNLLQRAVMLKFKPNRISVK